MNNWLKNLSIVVIALLQITAALSQSKVYKYVDENGKTVYTSIPPNNTNNVEEVDLQEANTIPAHQIKAKQKEVKQQHDSVSARIDKRISNREKRSAEIKAARLDIANKKAALEQGKVPLPGERRGTIGVLTGNATRLSEEYHERVGKLENELQVAEEKLKELLKNKY